MRSAKSAALSELPVPARVSVEAESPGSRAQGTRTVAVDKEVIGND